MLRDFLIIYLIYGFSFTAVGAIRVWWRRLPLSTLACVWLAANPIIWPVTMVMGAYLHWCDWRKPATR